jgi:two-component system, sensor histidine kinase
LLNSGRGVRSRIRERRVEGIGSDGPSEKGGTVRVLLIDDHSDTLEIFNALLESWGHEVRTIQQPTLAHSAALEFLPDLVLLDLGMPGLDGREVARLFREDPRFEGLFLVAVTGRTLEEVEAEGAVFDAHLMKPVDFHLLQGILEIPSGSGQGQTPD